MKKSKITTRGIAHVIDNVLLFIVFALIHFALFGTWFRHVSDLNISFATHPICLLFVVLYFSYFILLEGTRGVTIGKFVCRIKVIDQNGNKCNIKKSVIRNLFRLVDGIALYLVGTISIVISNKRQRLGDKFAGTFIVEKGSGK